ncbi:HAMP domain-containing sensor histidine kinase [Ichthyenterobacterium sp. W332]|uniref:histidine kinase n=1 Tax=Microcosmobacter mediterraneus TaxID=3075607 RepID=A0ABU2YKJ7_9FLAO|nr:HAMP domain-containing sensor histidine kinase [Ichthyenterobacterium sp. W332]MDT0557548.1 HAMP domain-containing sensor histidine kinase [Ichthyenterobacterium sp. W332]
MNKRLFLFLVVLMSLSLIGIIAVQSYFINDSYQNQDKQFELNVKRSLSFVANTIESKEFIYFSRKLKDYKEKTGVEADSTAFTNLFLEVQNEENDEVIQYSNVISEESYKVPSTFFDIGRDSIRISDLSNKRTKKVFKVNPLDGQKVTSSEKTFIEYSDLTELRKSVFETTFRDMFKDYPIYKRISAKTVERLLEQRLLQDGIELEFEFAIYDNDLATKVQSKNFEKQVNTNYGIPIFRDNNNRSDYNLLINFPERREFLFSTILGMLILSILFTSIIILAYSSALYQLIKQRQISQIKTDFINNMTHEFKTPIATINLALDAIKNPKIMGDEDKMRRYLKMIKDENKRMHAQVENVLRISKLDKNELNISKERIKLHDLIDVSVSHVQLIIDDRNGYVKTHLGAIKSSILANDTHFTNVLVNILDNAIKYSNDAPKIDIYTENVGNNIILKIADQGNGMSKQVQKRVFEKFYREHTGNVHNVKGHGLGLAYVKRIVDDHQGHISVESEKGKGSVFTLKLPLIS